jgi:predicted nucleic acid-binding Zn ribbon protein
MQHCEECGAELPNNALFCGRCGRKTTSEDELATNVNSAPLEEISMSPSGISMALNDSENSTSENGEEEKQQTPGLPLENNAEKEEQTSNLTSEDENEEQTPYHALEKQEARPVSKCLLFFLAGLIVIVGVVVALMGLFHLNLLGFGGGSNALSSSSDNEIINPTGSSLTASICVKTLTPSTSITNQGSTRILFSSSGCSTVIASKANSSCLIFPNATGDSHKYIFDVSNASIDSQSYHLVLGVVDYSGPTTYNDARHISAGLSEGSTGRNFSWLYRSGSVTINNDEQSGTMDVILEGVDGGNTLHIVGDWACGRQMKNT